MTMSADQVLYSINVEDVLTVAEQEFLPSLTKEPITMIGDTPVDCIDCIDWYEAIRLAIDEVVPASGN